MESKIFKTYNDAVEYAKINYPNDTFKDTTAEERDFDDSEELGDLSISGEFGAIESDNALLGYYEYGNEVYELSVNGTIVGTFNNIIDARDAAREAADDEESEVELKVEGPFGWEEVSF